MSASNQASSASGATPRRAQKGRWIKLVVVGILLAGVLAHLWDASGVGSSGARVPDGHRAVVEKSMLTLPSARERSRGAGASARPRERVLARAQSIGALRDLSATPRTSSGTRRGRSTTRRLPTSTNSTVSPARAQPSPPRSDAHLKRPRAPASERPRPTPLLRPRRRRPRRPLRRRSDRAPSPGRPSTVEVEARAVFDGDASARPATRDPDPSESDPSSLSWESSRNARNPRVTLRLAASSSTVCFARWVRGTRARTRLG